ncbi:hypothetical protein V8C43DRAFT_182229 [Trichoderma afarasin]
MVPLLAWWAKVIGELLCLLARHAVGSYGPGSRASVYSLPTAAQSRLRPSLAVITDDNGVSLLSLVACLCIVSWRVFTFRNGIGYDLGSLGKPGTESGFSVDFDLEAALHKGAGFFSSIPFFLFVSPSIS